MTAVGLADSLSAYQGLLSGYVSNLRSFSPENSVQAAEKEMLETFYEIKSSQNEAMFQIAKLQSDTIEDELQRQLIDSLQIESMEIPTDIIDDLYSMAGECPYEKGIAVLWARAAFPDSIFANFCEITDSSSARLGSLPETNPEELQTALQTDQVKVYPNPVLHHSFTVEVQNGISLPYLEVYDLFGRKQFEVKLNSGINTIQTPMLSAGLYLYKVMDSGNLIKQDRIVLLK